MPLEDISIMRVAGDLGVTRGSIHYHLNRREDLAVAVFNLFNQVMVSRWPVLSGSWRSDLEAIANVMYNHFLRYAGVAGYFATRNRFRMLLAALEQDSGPLMEFQERLFSAVRAVGLDATRSATYASLLIQFIHNSAHHTAAHEWPAEERKLANYFAKASVTQFPSIVFMRDSFSRLDGRVAFEAGLGLILAGLEKERERSN